MKLISQVAVVWLSCELQLALAKGYLPTSDPVDLEGFDIAVVSVPTPLHDRMPDLRYIEAECERLGIPAPLIGPTREWYAKLLETGRGNDEAAAIYELLKDARP